MRSASKNLVSSAKIFRLIESDLKEIEARLKTEATSNLALLETINKYLHESGGKRLRPGLLLLFSKLFGIRGNTPLQLGVVVELIHVATLVHDDIIDNSAIRRGRPSVNAKWGNDVTVLFGDWLYMTAFWVALQERNFRILDILIEITRKMVEGELLQLERNHRLDVSLDDYLQICWHKTANLFSGCGSLAAAVAGADGVTEEAAATYGRALGMAFQLTDDLLDYTSSQSVLGKPVLKDLEEGSVTLPMIHTYQQATASEQSLIREIVEGRQFSMENKEIILGLVDAKGGLDEARRCAFEYAEEAREAIRSLPGSLYRDALSSLPELVISRKN